MAIELTHKKSKYSLSLHKEWGIAAFLNNFHYIYAKTNAKSIWLYMNSTISWLIQQLVMRSNLGDGAGKIETYELADFPLIAIDLENMDIDPGPTKNYKEEFGSLESLKTVNPARIKLDSAILEAIGYKKKKEREEVLLELYKATYQLINARFKKAQSMKTVKAQRNKVGWSAYIEQLKTMLIDGRYIAKNTITFGKEVENLISEITAEKKMQKKILDAYWKERFGEYYDENTIVNNDQMSLFK